MWDDYVSTGGGDALALPTMGFEHSDSAAVYGHDPEEVRLYPVL